ncbi:MAG: four helix bundle protein [Patescibacteria group bacterium]|nr:four helix bundle protein [Patescibacteria group bacterium]
MPHVPKDFRYSLGAKIDRSLIEVAELLFVASYLPPQQKIPYLQKANTRLDLAKFFLQILWDVGGLDVKKYILLSEKLNEIGRELGGWINGLASKSKPPAK